MRIVSLLSSATEILFALGLGDEVVAISHECDYPAAAMKLPRATRSLVDSSQSSERIDQQVKALCQAGAALYEIDHELIRGLAPDLIVTQAQCDVCAVRYQDVIDFVTAEPTLRRTRVVALNPSSLQDILQDILRVGEAARALEAAQRYVCKLQMRVERVGKVAGTLPAPPCGDTLRPSVVCIEWIEPLMTAGNWTPELIELAGGRSLLAEAGRHSGCVAWDAVVDAAPEALLVAPCGFDLKRSLAEARRLWELPGFADLPAVRTSRSFVIDGNAYLNRSGPRIMDSLEILAHLIRPKLFAPLDGELAEGRAWARL